MAPKYTSPFSLYCASGLLAACLSALPSQLHAAGSTLAQANAVTAVNRANGQPTEATKVIPLRGILYTEESIAAVRRETETNPTAKAVARAFISGADRWMRYSDSELDALFPPDDALYAYGFNGDPKVDKPWSWWGRSGEVSLDRPGVVRSTHTGDIYGNQKPGEPFYDDGKGWTRPADGKVFYFKGVWNAWIVRALHDAVDDLSLAYMLTGKEHYAQRALHILDRFASMRAVRPAKDGAIDWHNAYGEGYGFFIYMGNLANDRMVATVFALDLVGRSAAAAAPSATNPKVSTLENIRKNYFSVFEKWYIEKRSSFQNHGISAYAGEAAPAVLFGYPQEIRRGIDAANAFLDNTVDRDGEYYEVSTNYGEIGRIYGGMLLSLFTNYNPNNYPDPQQFPSPSQYPNHLRFGNDPAWFQTAVTSLYRITVHGSRRPHYGNTPSVPYTADKQPPSTTPNLYELRATYLRLFYPQTDNPLWQAMCRLLYAQLPKNARDNTAFMRKGVLQYGPSQWMQLPVASTQDQQQQVPWFMREDVSTATGQKRFVLLRSGSGKMQRALFARGGVANSHSQDEQLGISMYSHGMLLNGEYGAGLWGTPDHYGWATRAAAHKMLVVDEDLPASALFPQRPPASIDALDANGTAQVMEMSNPVQWSDAALEEYRRQTWMIDLPNDQAYFIDIFRASGGKTHDYFWNAPAAQSEQGMRLEGISPTAQRGVWTLAALGSPRYRSAAFNQPGQSWGERVDIGSGTIRDVGIRGENLPRNRWNPEPGNGYGFIWDIKTADTADTWSAIWPLHDGKHQLKFTMVMPDPHTVVSAKTPAFAPGKHHESIVVRREAKGSSTGSPLSSRFASVTQVGEANTWPLKKIQPINTRSPRAIAIALQHADGSSDTVLSASALAPEVRTAYANLDGRRGFIRRDAQGALREVQLGDGTRIESTDFTLQLPAAAWDGTVTAVTAQSVELSTKLPPAEVFAAQGVSFASPPNARHRYSANEFFIIEDIAPAADAAQAGSTLVFHTQKVAAGRVFITGKTRQNLLQAAWPNELPASLIVRQPDFENRSRVFDGHLLIGQSDPSRQATILDYAEKTAIRVDNPQAIAADAFYLIMATRPGDVFRIPSQASLRRSDSGWSLRANMDVRLKLQGEWMLAGSASHATTAETAAKSNVNALQQPHQPNQPHQPLVKDREGFFIVPLASLGGQAELLPASANAVATQNQPIESRHAN